MYSQLGVARSFMFEVYGADSFIGSERQRRVLQPASVLRPPSNLLLLLNTNPADAGAAAGAAAATSPPRLLMLAPSRRRRAPLDYFGVWGGRRDARDAQARRVLASATSLLAAEPSTAAPPLAAQDDANFDCVGYFNPVAQADYERTVDAWADALLVVVNQSTLTMEEAGRQ